MSSAVCLLAVTVCSIVTAVKMWGQWLTGSKSASEEVQSYHSLESAKEEEKKTQDSTVRMSRPVSEACE